MVHSLKYDLLLVPAFYVSAPIPALLSVVEDFSNGCHFGDVFAVIDPDLLIEP